VTVDLDTIVANTICVGNLLRAKSEEIGAVRPEVMAIVKANAYGHGLLEAAHATLKGGATWLGVAKISEALELRNDLDKDTQTRGCSHQNTRIFSWIYGPDAPYTEMLRADLDVSVSTCWEIDKFAEAAKALGAPESGRAARLHIKVDTGFGRNGFTNIGPDFETALGMIKAYEEQGLVKLEGVWSHLACADEPDNQDAVAQTAAQFQAFEQKVAQIEATGLAPRYKHISASAGVLLYPNSYYNLVRPGLILYGVSPNPAQIDVKQYGLRPAMKLEVQMNNVKKVAAGQGISYGHRYHAKQDTNIGIVPLGYADGIMRSASGTDDKLGAPVLVGDKLAHIAGRVCMDQFMVDIGPETDAQAGDWVTLFGPGRLDPSVDDWAKAAGTISYEILSKTTQQAPIINVEAPATGLIPIIFD
jgi:alanine racemase